MDINKLKFAHKESKYLTNLLSGLTHYNTKPGQLMQV